MDLVVARCPSYSSIAPLALCGALRGRGRGTIESPGYLSCYLMTVDWSTLERISTGIRTFFLDSAQRILNNSSKALIQLKISLASPRVSPICCGDQNMRGRSL